MEEAIENIKDAIKGYLYVERKNNRLNDFIIPKNYFLGEVAVGQIIEYFREKAVRAFKKIGYRVDHQTGSHMIQFHPERQTLSVPDHKELAPGLLRGIIRSSGLTVDEFLKYL